MSSLAALPRWSIELLRFAAMIAIALTVATVYTARGDNHDTTYHACLFAGSLSQVGTTEPANCGRGTAISWNAEGIQGLQGPPGMSNLRSNNSGAVTSDGTSVPVIVPCPTDLVPISSGYFQTDGADSLVVRNDFAVANADADNPYGFVQFPDSPMPTDYGWQFSFLSLGGQPVEAVFFVYCADVEPPPVT